MVVRTAAASPMVPRPRSPSHRPDRSEEIAMSTLLSSRTLHLVLIKPSRYDDDGYVVRHWRGVLPSNTLAAMHSLTEQVASSGALGAGVEVRTAAYDETVQRVDPAAIARRLGPRRPADVTVIALVAVQTNQWPRAADEHRQSPPAASMSAASSSCSPGRPPSS